MSDIFRQLGLTPANFKVYLVLVDIFLMAIFDPLFPGTFFTKLQKNENQIFVFVCNSNVYGKKMTRNGHEI